VTDDTVTGVLRQVARGAWKAADDLLPFAYRELKTIAPHQLKGERRGHLLNATAVVHEAYLRPALNEISWNDRGHFFAVAGRAVRRVLIDHAEEHRAQVRGGDFVHVSLDDPVAAPERRVETLLAPDEALMRLEQLDPRQVRRVECHVFAGMSLDDTAAPPAISPATVSRGWPLARAWLSRALRAEAQTDG
jgi:RNA polymerase sigma factor (TIGR02999 family)